MVSNDKILNPETNRYVLKTGAIGKKLLKAQAAKKGTPKKVTKTTKKVAVKKTPVKKVTKVAVKKTKVASPKKPYKPRSASPPMRKVSKQEQLQYDLTILMMKTTKLEDLKRYGHLYKNLLSELKKIADKKTYDYYEKFTLIKDQRKLEKYF